MTDAFKAEELEQQLRGLQQRIASLEDQVSGLRQRNADQEQHLRGRDERIAELQRYLLGRQQRICDLEKVDAAAVLEQRDRLQDTLDSVHASAMWRLTAPLRAVLDGMTPGHRNAVRRFAKLCYWVVTPHLMRQRLRFLKSRNQQAGRSAAQSETAASSPGSSNP